MENTEERNEFVVLMETSGEECESWYYFIKWKGNEEALEYLDKQIQEIDMHIIDDLCTFDLDLENKVSESTAREMIKLELNSVTFHRKFNGKMAKIHIGLKKKDTATRRIKRINNKIGLGKIADFIEDEEVLAPLEGDSDENSSEEEDGEELFPLAMNQETKTDPPSLKDLLSKVQVTTD